MFGKIQFQNQTCLCISSRATTCVSVQLPDNIFQSLFYRLQEWLRRKQEIGVIYDLHAGLVISAQVMGLNGDGSKVILDFRPPYNYHSDSVFDYNWKGKKVGWFKVPSFR